VAFRFKKVEIHPAQLRAVELFQFCRSLKFWFIELYINETAQVNIAAFTVSVALSCATQNRGYEKRRKCEALANIAAGY